MNTGLQPIGLRTIAIAGISWAALVANPMPGFAQSGEISQCAVNAIASDNAVAQINALGRAKNLARQAAEAANGGLGGYRAEAAMHGPVSAAPCVDNGNGSWTFTVKGGAPGFTTPTQETVVTVDSNGWTVKVDYNGPVRS
ncbi:MAG: hypothetical protein NW220_14475 [Leptolyngbyaceae cyanobacterium bins.349]|nr:hypothetical protein [Leptolyngbyaceae cyanobacterium bins.349]